MMLTDSQLQTLLGRLGNLGHLKLGRGPKHPNTPNPALDEELTTFLNRYPFVRHDEGYVQFLSEYAGAVLWRDQDALSLELFGFCSDISTHLIRGPGKTVEYGYLTFCDMVIPPKADPFASNARGLGFGFDATGNRKAGVHRLWGQGQGDYFCKSFTEWLQRFIKHKGRLDEAMPAG